MKRGKIEWFCVNCGAKQYKEISERIGRDWWACSMSCHDKMSLKTANSILGIDLPPKRNEMEKDNFKTFSDLHNFAESTFSNFILAEDEHGELVIYTGFKCADENLYPIPNEEEK